MVHRLPTEIMWNFLKASDRILTVSKKRVSKESFKIQ
jgi:hypothetical protein